MAKTAKSDVIIPEIFNPYLVEQTAIKSNFFRSGIVRTAPEFNSLLAGGGETFNFPFWQTIVGANDSSVLSEGTPLTVKNITASSMVARRMNRGEAWGSNDLVKIGAGSDPIAQIVSGLASYWSYDFQNIILNQLTGIFLNNAAADSSDLINDIAIEDGNAAGDSNLIGPEAIIDSKQKLGDSKEKLQAIVMHSICHARLQKLNLIDFTPTNVQNIGWGTYMGSTVIVDDGMTKVAGSTSGFKYSTYLFAPGSIAFGEDSGSMENEADRDILAGDSIITSRRNFSFHPAGFKWLEASVVGDSPTNAELALAANWDRVFEQKNTGIVKLLTNG